VEGQKGDKTKVEYAADLPVNKFGSGFPRDKTGEKQYFT
jgi:hypothetical protein